MNEAATPSRPLARGLIAVRMRAAILAHPVLARWLLAGPGAVCASVAFVTAMPLWLPEGVAGIDHLVWPIMLAPLIWAVFCTYTCLEENLVRSAVVIVAVTSVCSALGGLAMLGLL